MIVVKPSELSGETFNPIFINALRQYWKTTKSFQCIASPKKYNLFLYLDGCRITYTDKNGEIYEAKSGEVVYTPEGSEYRAILSDFSSPASHTVGINFLLADEACEKFVLSDKIKIFRPDSASAISALFERAALNDGGGITLENRIILLRILSLLASEAPCRDFSLVSEAIRLLSENVEENLSVSELARLCNVSEVYLRSRFKEAMGVSPAKYRNGLRLDKAASYLRFGDISVQEISDAVGYSTVSHFIKEFKLRFGISPLQYRKKEDAEK